MNQWNGRNSQSTECFNIFLPVLNAEGQDKGTITSTSFKIYFQHIHTYYIQITITRCSIEEEAVIHQCNVWPVSQRYFLEYPEAYSSLF